MQREPASKTEIKDALSDTSRIISELTRDIAIARANGNDALAKRLLDLKLHYMEKRGGMSRQLTLMRRRRYDE